MRALDRIRSHCSRFHGQHFTKCNKSSEESSSRDTWGGGRGGAMMRLACVCSTGSSALLGRAAPPTGTPRPLKAPKNTYAHAISSTTDGFTRCTAAAPRGSSLQGNKHVLRARGHRNPACFALSRTSFALAIKMSCPHSQLPKSVISCRTDRLGQVSFAAA